jgi:hypothetical protein
MARHTDSEAKIADALEALRTALESVDISLSRTLATGPADIDVEALVDGRAVWLKVEVVAYCTGDRARGLIARVHPHGQAVPFVVADRITVDARAHLDDAGWGWFDRRGRLHLTADQLRLRTDVPAEVLPNMASGSKPAIAGRGGLTVAYWLCERHDGERLSPTGHGHALRLAPSTISVAARRLTEAGLVDEGIGVFPELFWELAAHWRPERVWLAERPQPAHHQSADPGASQWVRTGTAAAAAWGAPIVTGEGGPLELYVPGPVDLSIAARRYGAAEAGTSVASLAVPPVSTVTAASPDGPARIVDGWPLAPRLAVALDLAQDKARGRQILEEWKVDNAPWH